LVWVRRGVGHEVRPPVRTDRRRGVMVDQKLQGLLDARIVPLEERAIGAEQVLAIGLENGAGLPVGGVFGPAAEADQTQVRVKAGAEVLHLSRRSLQLGKQVSRGL